MAIFNLKKMNTLYKAPIDGFPDRMEQVGEEVSKGIEFDVAGLLLQIGALLLTTLIMMLKLRKQKMAKKKDFGKQRPNSPKHTGNLWTKYIIGSGALRGLGIGVGYNFVTERYGKLVEESILWCIHLMEL